MRFASVKCKGGAPRSALLLPPLLANPPPSPIPSPAYPFHCLPSPLSSPGDHVKKANMAVVVWLLLLLSCSIAGQATPTLALATPLVAHSTGIDGNAEPGYLLVKRTSSSPSPLRWSVHRQRTARQPVQPNHTPHIAAPLPHVLGGSILRAATPSHVPAAGPSADATVPQVLTKLPYPANRRPRGLLARNPIEKALSIREANAKRRARYKLSKPTARMRLGSLKYATATDEEIRAINNAREKQWKSTLTPEQKADIRRRRNESTKRWRERVKARLRGNNSPEPPLRRQGAKILGGEQEQAGAHELRQHTPADARMEEAVHRAVDGPHALPGTHGPPATLRLKTPESSSSSWSVPSSPHPEASHHRLAPGPSFSPLDLRNSLPAQGSSTSAQSQTRALRPAAPLPAIPIEEDSLRLTLAPPGEHDRLRLTLAPPRHD